MSDHHQQKREFMRQIRARHPPFREAVLADARITARYRGERYRFRSRADVVQQVLRLCWVSDAFAAQLLYRLKADLQRRGVPLLPRLAHRLAMVVAQVSIGDPVVVQPGIYIIHGQVVIDGLVEVGRSVVIAPWVTIGLRAGNVQGAVIGDGVQIGSGAKLVGPIEVGDGVQIGANAVVTSDLAPGVTAVGVPARAVPARSADADDQLASR